MIKFFNNFINPYFWSILRAKLFFLFKNMTFSHEIPCRFLTLFQKFEKKIQFQEYARTDGRMNGKKFYRSFTSYHQGSNNLRWRLRKIFNKTIIMELSSLEILTQRYLQKSFFWKFRTINCAEIFLIKLHSIGSSISYDQTPVQVFSCNF